LPTDLGRNFTVKIFGFSLVTLLLFFAFFWLGTKNPGALAKVPVVGAL